MMPTCIDERLLGDGIVPPEDKYDSFSFLREYFDSSVRKVFPSYLLVARRFSLSDSEDSIEKQNSLLCPVSEVCLGASNPQVRLEFFEDILQARLWF